MATWLRNGTLYRIAWVNSKRFVGLYGGNRMERLDPGTLKVLVVDDNVPDGDELDSPTPRMVRAMIEQRETAAIIAAAGL